MNRFSVGFHYFNNNMVDGSIHGENKIKYIFSITMESNRSFPLLNTMEHLINSIKKEINLFLNEFLTLFLIQKVNTEL